MLLTDLPKKRDQSQKNQNKKRAHRGDHTLYLGSPTRSQHRANTARHIHFPLKPLKTRPVFQASALAFFMVIIGSVAAPAQAETTPNAYISSAIVPFINRYKHSQKLTVSSNAQPTPITRDGFTASSPEEAQQNVFNAVAAPGTNVSWAKLVLLYGGWPVSDNNVTVITRWMRQENGTNDWWNRNNPLNNSYGAPGAGGTGTDPNLKVAAQNVAAALHSGIGGGYGGIVASLAASATPSVTAAAIWASGWSSSHYANGTHWSSAPVDEVAAPSSAW